ncbi:hypothetical protein [Pseudomonas sp. BJa3]|jgi:hypothetical protein|uniref:hypothetical protein n=1 Tax=Pseudomonas sp. BJa3 TaxID=2986525 RepID=UPI002265E65C|nr:hypothetical protein [Pseudomonas sp. BJa3]MCX5511194.1 hypothetical protein [Pseudomonas sp. BJa3]
MTSLLFYTDDNEATVVTDTLIATKTEELLGFANKAIYIEKLRLICAGTGAAELFTRWISFMNKESRAFDVDSLNHQATKRLQSIWSEMQRETPAFANYTATVYLFGLSNDTGLIHSYVYRSESGFVSSRLAHGLAMKPAITPDQLEGVEYRNFPASSKEIMRRQAELECLKPKGDRVLIGGDANVITLTQAGCQFSHLGPLGIDLPH